MSNDALARIDRAIQCAEALSLDDLDPLAKDNIVQAVYHLQRVWLIVAQTDKNPAAARMEVNPVQTKES